MKSCSRGHSLRVLHSSSSAASRFGKGTQFSLFAVFAQGRKRGSLEFKVSEKGGMSVYGLGRFPVTLYYEQWVRLLDQVEQIREFLEANKAGMKMKHAE